jgi:RNA polymerase sigma-70 factor (ECF subfamily)
MAELADRVLLDRLRRGDSLALEVILERYESSLFPFLLGLLRDHQRAEDALQETFIKTLTHLDRIDPEKLKPWLFQVAYREAMMLRRKEKRQQTSEQELFEQLADPLPPGSEQVELLDDQRRLRELLDQLPKAQREVIVARIYHGKRFLEIANELGCPLNTALARMHDGLKKLRILWEAAHD